MRIGLFVVLSLAIGATACGSSDAIFPSDGGSSGALPAVPQNLQAKAATSDRVYVSWDRGKASQFKLYRDGSLVGSVDLKVDPERRGSTFLDIGLKPNTQYCYTTSSLNAAGESDQTSPVCATTFANADPCAVHTGCLTGCFAATAEDYGMVVHYIGCGWCESLGMCLTSPSKGSAGPDPNFAWCPPGPYTLSIGPWDTGGGCPSPPNPACQNCIHSCQGVEGCCTGCGCMCEEECGGGNFC